LSHLNFFEKHPLLLLQVMGWSVYLIADLFDHFAKGHYLLLPSLVCSVTAFILTGVVAHLTNRFESKGKRIQAFFFITSIMIATILWHKVWAIFHGESDTLIQMWHQFTDIPNYSLSQWLTTGYYPLFLFLAWTGFFVGSKWFFALQANRLLLNDAQLQAKQAQLQTLRYQLNPHFLFNVLNNIDVSVMSDDKATAHKMLQHLSSFLRNSLQQGEQDKITLEEEVLVLKDFINIEQIRFGDALSIVTSIDTACEAMMLPPMLLQPLVENAIKFAWSQSEHGVIKITATKHNGQLKVEIENSKADITPMKSGTGTGLKNTQDRLTLVYADDAQLTTLEKHKSYTVTIVLPCEISIC
jgi:LytS/YehU family sensor histidine kinase